MKLSCAVPGWEAEHSDIVLMSGAELCTLLLHQELWLVAVNTGQWDGTIAMGRDKNGLCNEKPKMKTLEVLKKRVEVISCLAAWRIASAVTSRSSRLEKGRVWANGENITEESFPTSKPNRGDKGRGKEINR